MLIQKDSTKKCFQSQTEKFVYAPVSLICDKNITYKERSLMIANYAFAKKSKSCNFKFTEISTLALKYSNFKSKTPTKALLRGLKSLQNKGYIKIIDGKYVVILEEKFQESPSIGLGATPFYSKNININMLGLIAFLNGRQPTNINCVGYIAKAVGLDKNTVYKYLHKLEKLNFVESRPSSINGKETPNYHIIKGHVFYGKPKRVAPVDNFGINPVDGVSQNSSHRDNYYNIIIKYKCNNAKKLEYRNKNKMFTLRDFIDSKNKYQLRIVDCIRSKLYFKNKLVTNEEIIEKLTDVYLELEKDGIIKVFTHANQFINFGCMLFKTSSYPLEKGINDLNLLKDIQFTVKHQKGETYSIPFIKWLATKLFAPDFRIYHLNVFKDRMVEALMNENRKGEETEYWSDEQYTDWDMVHRTEKKKYIDQYN